MHNFAKIKLKSATSETGLEQVQDNPNIFIKVYFDAAFILCLCPFRFDKCSVIGSDVHYLMKIRVSQKLLCVVLTFLGSLHLVKELRYDTPSDTRDPAMYFKLGCTFFDTLLKVVTMKQFWLDGNKLLNLVNFKIKNMTAPSTTWKVFGISLNVKLLGIVMTCIYIAHGAIKWIAGPAGFIFTMGTRMETQTIQDWSLEWWWDSMIKIGRLNFFLDENEVYSVDVVIGVLAAMGYLQRRLWGLFTDLYILVMALTLHSVVSVFIKDLIHEGDEDIDDHILDTPWSVIHTRFQDLQKMAKMINRIIGTNVTILLIFMVLYGATSMDELIFNPVGPKDFVRYGLVGFLYLSYGTILWVSGDICHQVNIARYFSYSN